MVGKTCILQSAGDTAESCGVSVGHFDRSTYALVGVVDRSRLGLQLAVEKFVEIFELVQGQQDLV